MNLYNTGAAGRLARYGIILVVIGLTLLTGCISRNGSDNDNRTLEKKPVVETVKPDNRADPFRP